MLTLKSLSFENIRSFTDKQTLDFHAMGNLIQVDGVNNNTGGSSGAGKTTIFLALDYLLGISDIPSTVLQSRLTKDPICVSGVFDVDGKPLSIIRSKSKGLSVDYNGETITGNVKAAEEKISELIGIPKKIFKKMVHKKQKEGGFFLEMTAKEVYEFLSNVLGLDKYLNRVEAISEDIKEKDQRIQSLANTIEKLTQGIEDLETIVKNRKKPTCNYTPEDIEKIKKEIEGKEEELSDLSLTLEEKLSQVPKPIKSDRLFDSTEMIKLTTQIEELSKTRLKKQPEIQGYRDSISRIPELKNTVKNKASKINDLQKQNEKIRQAICPTCSSNWVQGGKTLDANLNTIKELTEDILKAKPMILQEKSLNDLISESSEQLNTLEVKIDALKKLEAAEAFKKQQHEATLDIELREKNSEYQRQQGNISKEYETPMSLAKEVLAELRSDLKQRQYEVDSYRVLIEEYNAEMANHENLLLGKKTSIKEATESMENTTQSIKVAEESQRLIKTYVIDIFQETLDMIGQAATHILSEVPNMATSTIYFEGCKENKDGSLKNEVNAVLNSEGLSTPIKSLSGGERTTIDLAVDLAVIDVIESKTNKGANFFIVDEPFDGLDSVCKENYLDILKKIDTNKQIIMVDHSSELKEMVSEVITVSKNKETSCIL